MPDAWRELLVAAVYLILAFVIGRRFGGRHTTAPAGFGTQITLGVTLGVHALVVAEQIFVSDRIRLGFENALAFTALGVTAAFWVTAWLRPIGGLAVIVLPVAAASLAIMAFPVTRNDFAIDGSSAVLIHILFSVCAYGVLAFAALQAAVTAYQDHQLHHHRPNAVLLALPPLQVMEKLLFQLIGLGFVLLTLSLATGFVFVSGGGVAGLIEKSLLSIGAWIMFAVLLVGRIRIGWRGQTALRWTLAGFAALAAAYLGTKIVVTLLG